MRRFSLTLLICTICSIFIIILVLPRGSKFGYSYEEGRPWLYPSLIAAYDFPIYKSEARLQADRDSAASSVEPFFNLADSMASLQSRKIFADWQSKRFGNVPYEYVQHVKNMLEEIYSHGLMSNADSLLMYEAHVGSLCVISGTAASKINLSETFTPLSAYRHIMQAAPARLQRSELVQLHLNEYLKPNLSYDSVRTRAALSDALGSVSSTTGMVQSGQKIVDRGEIVDEETLAILNSFKRESELRDDNTNKGFFLLAGQAGLVCGVIFLMVFYLRLYRRDVMLSSHHVSLLFVLLTLFPVLTALMVRHEFLNVYLLPYAMAPIFIRIFIDSRTAAMHLIAMTVLSSLCLQQPYPFILTQFVAGLVAIYSLRSLTARAQIFKTALIVTLCSCLVGVFIDFIQGATFQSVDLKVLYYKLVSGVLLLFTYPLMYLIERLFNFTSDVTLIELTNINHPLLRRMSREAQGTFQHSMQVANLAAEVAQAIHAKTLLVRTGALYHDIGKMQAPAFFTENQSGQNPHDKLEEERSAAIIIAHVTDGLRLAEKHQLPEEIREFILTHHGTSLVRYFYQQAVNRRGEDQVNRADFTYPGKSPHTREQAILTMADAVEAASRSLKEYTEENIQALVHRVIDAQLQDGLFKQCPISFADIRKAEKVFVDNLKMVYHTRISYPEATPPAPQAPTPRRHTDGKGYLFGFRTHNKKK